MQNYTNYPLNFDRFLLQFEIKHLCAFAAHILHIVCILRIRVFCHVKKINFSFVQYIWHTEYVCMCICVCLRLYFICMMIIYEAHKPSYGIDIQQQFRFVFFLLIKKVEEDLKFEIIYAKYIIIVILGAEFFLLSENRYCNYKLIRNIIINSLSQKKKMYSIRLSIFFSSFY